MVAKLPVVTSIQVRAETKQRLAALGKFNESFDDVVSRILDHYEARNITEEVQHERNVNRN